MQSISRPATSTLTVMAPGSGGRTGEPLQVGAVFVRQLGVFQNGRLFSQGSQSPAQCGGGAYRVSIRTAVGQQQKGVRLLQALGSLR